jgi:sugar phosphate isomerase/epimerase
MTTPAGSFAYSYNMVTYGNEDPRRGLERIARAGYERVELSGDPPGITWEDLNQAIIDNGLEVSSISSLLGPGRDLSHADPSFRRAGHDYLLHLIDMASVVGSPIINVHPSSVNRTEVLTTVEQEWEWSVEGLRSLATHADGTCRLAVEPWNRYETHLINTLGQAVELVIAVDHPAVCVMGDTFHMGIEESDPLGALHRAAPHLGHMHLADNTRAAPGTGTVDFAPYIRTLIEIDYPGTVTFELFPAKARPLESVISGDAPEFFDDYTQASLAHLRAVETSVRSQLGTG